MERQWGDRNGLFGGKMKKWQVFAIEFYGGAHHAALLSSDMRRMPPARRATRRAAWPATTTCEYTGIDIRLPVNYQRRGILPLEDCCAQIVIFHASVRYLIQQATTFSRLSPVTWQILNRTCHVLSSFVALRSFLDNAKVISTKLMEEKDFFLCKNKSHANHSKLLLVVRSMLSHFNI